jgi:CRISPR-associated endonuclease Cas3-HD
MSAGLFSAPGEIYLDHINRCQEKLGIIMKNFISTIKRVFNEPLPENELEKYFQRMVIYHDIGKLTKSWQERLGSGRKLPNHAAIGAAVFYKVHNSEDIPESIKNAVSFAIAIHHTDRGLLGDNIEKPDVQAILDGIADNNGYLIWDERKKELEGDYFPEEARKLSIADLKSMARGLRLWAKGCGLLEQHKRRMQACLAHHILKLCDISAAAARKEYQSKEDYFGGWLMVENIKDCVDAMIKRV